MLTLCSTDISYPTMVNLMGLGQLYGLEGTGGIYK